MTPSELYGEVSKQLAEKTEIPPFDPSLSYYEVLELYEKFHGWYATFTKLCQRFPLPYNVAVEIDPSISISMPEDIRYLWWKSFHYPSDYPPEIDAVLKLFEQLHDNLRDRCHLMHRQYEDWYLCATEHGYEFASN